MTTEARLYHPNRRDCPAPRWVQRVYHRSDGSAFTSQPPDGDGNYVCPGHKVSVHEILRVVAQEEATNA